MDDKKKIKRWAIITYGTLFGVLLLIALAVLVIDPYFHFHGPVKGVSYSLDEERYQNDGIVKHFDYDTLIIGTSMCQNFRTSQCDELFGSRSVKVTFSGGSYKEVGDCVRVALEYNPKLQRVIRGLDYSWLIRDKDAMYIWDGWPEYLTDQTWTNDSKYLWNMQTMSSLLKVFVRTIAGVPMTSFDDYAAWREETSYGKEHVLAGYEVVTQQPEEEVTQEFRDMVRQNVRQNVVEVAKAYPDTTFYLFFTPYSICFWDAYSHAGRLSILLEAERIAIEELLSCENVVLFSFTDEFELICNLDNYKDEGHYGPWINDYILESMKEGRGIISADNCEEYFKRVEQFYRSYDYDLLRE